MFERARTLYADPTQLQAASSGELRQAFGSLGLAWRLPLISRLATCVRTANAIPESEEALIQLPGIGPYAAAAYLSLHRKRRAVIVDANVVRWLGRLFGFPFDGETRRKHWLKDLAEILTPTVAFRDYNYAVLDFSMQVCNARPECTMCPFSSQGCHYYEARQEHADVDGKPCSRHPRLIRRGDV